MKLATTSEGKNYKSRMKTSIKPFLWVGKPLKSGLFTIKIRITRNRKSDYITTPFSASVKQWDEKSGRVYKTHPNFQEINDHLESQVIEAQNMYKVAKISNPVAELKRKQAEIFNVPSFIAYLENHMARLDKKGKFGTRKKYNTLFRHLKVHLGNKSDLFFHEINKTFLEDFQVYLEGCGVNTNGIITYYKGFKKLYNQAINDDVFTPEKNAFKKFALPEQEEVDQRHLSLDQLKRVLLTDIPKEDDLFKYKCYFLFQIFAHGMRVSDIDLLRWSNFTENSIDYQMLKTKKKMKVPYNKNALKLLRFFTGYDYSEFEQYHKLYENDSTITDIGQSIAWDLVKDEFYAKILADIQVLATDPKTRDKFVFPILNQFEFSADKKTLTKKQYGLMESRNSIYNQHLKTLAERSGLERIQLSTHYCRHTFTHLLIILGTDIYDISKCLGHSHLSTTQVYADKFNLPRVQKVSELVDGLVRV